ncbi:MAG: dipeptidase [Spirochaetia bacterium]|jgi:membrane dipeptidase|nr:dipeptidase [Spirochaetia bacterium]
MLKEYSVIDAHCDTLLSVIGANAIAGIQGRLDFFKRNEKSYIDLPKLLEGGVTCQFFALFVEDSELLRAKAQACRLLDEFDALCEGSQGRLFPLLGAADLDKAHRGNSVAGLLSIEGAEALEGSLDNLGYFYNRGVRALGITWNRRNPFGRGVRTEGTDGLSPLGLELVEAMENLGMIVDASHLSDQAFWDLAAVAKRPFIASHSNARALNPFPRNLLDEQVRRIADSGGVVGAVFVPDFITADPPSGCFEPFLDHIDYLVKVGGEDAVGIGSDFDGYTDKGFHVLADASEFPLLAQGLERRGYGAAAVAKILSGNWERLIREILA